MLGFMAVGGNEFSEMSKKVYDGIIPYFRKKKHVFVGIKEKIDFSFVNALCEDLYSKDQGRPAYPPEMIFRGAVVEYFRNMSDRETEEDITANILDKWFVGLEVDDQSFDYSTISKFRTRLGPEKFDEIFNKILDIIQEEGLLSKRDRIIGDAACIMADIGIPYLTGLIKQACQKIISTLGKIDKEIIKEFEGKFVETYYEKIEMPRIKRKQLLIRLMKDARILIEVAEEKLNDNIDEKLRQELREKLNVLLQILRENIKETVIQTDGGKPEKTYEELNKKPANRITNLVDPDVKFGAKSNRERFWGYKTNMLMSERGFITTIRGFSGNHAENQSLIDLVDEQTVKLWKPQIVITDGMYATGENLIEMKKRKVKFIAHPRRFYDEEHFKMTNFAYNPRRNILQCIGGRISRKSHIAKDGRKHFFFYKNDCLSCPHKDKCVPADKSGRRRTTVSQYFQIFKEHRKFAESDFFKENKGIRYKVEQKIGEMKTQHGLNKVRYRGLKKLDIQLKMTGIVTNLKRFVRLSEKNN